MRYLLKPVFMFFLTFSSQIVSQWKPVQVPDNSWHIGWAIDASDPSSCAFSANSDIYLTNNSGVSWRKLVWPNNLRSGMTMDISMTDSLHIWAGVSDGRIIATTDGGKSWTTQYNDVNQTNFINYIKMFDQYNGIAMGDPKSESKPPVILKTTNSGLYWNCLNSDTIKGGSSGNIWKRVDFVDIKTGYFQRGSAPYPELFRTTNSGVTWTATNLKKYLQVVKFYDENIGLAYNYGIIYRTKDGGHNWEILPIQSKGYGESFEFLPNNPSKVWFTNMDNLWFSSDTGKTWQQVSLPLKSASCRDIHFVNLKVGWVLADDGFLWRTENNGGLPTDVNNNFENSLPVTCKLFQNSPNPFNPSTTISYDLPTAGFVSLKIYDLLGREIKTLVNDYQQAGSYHQSFSTSALNLSSGVYFYQLRAGGPSRGSGQSLVQTKKMILVK